MAISSLQDAQIIPLVATTIQEYSLWGRVLRTLRDADMGASLVRENGKNKY